MPDRPDYRIEVRDTAAKEMRLLPSDIKDRAIKAVNGLARNPRPRGSLRLKGSSDNLYRIRVGVYRIVYSVDDAARLVVVTRVRHRREVYG